MLVAVEVEPGFAVGVPDPALAHPALVGAVEVALRVGVDLEDGPVVIDPGAVDLCQGGGGEVVLAQLFGGVAGRLLAQLFGGVAGRLLVRFGDGVVCRVIGPAAGGQADAESGSQQEGKKSFLFHGDKPPFFQFTGKRWKTQLTKG